MVHHSLVCMFNISHGKKIKKKKDLQEGEAKGKLKSYMVKDGERRNIPSARIRQQQFPMLGQEIR